MQVCSHTAGLAAVSAFIVVLTISGCTAVSPHRSQASIENKLYKITPLGTSFEVATNELAKRFGTIYSSDSTGFVEQDWPEPPRVVGVKSIEVDLGDYHASPIATVSATAYWGFDDKDKLIEIWVWKTVDSL
jgi:hypothetical protein